MWTCPRGTASATYFHRSLKSFHKPLAKNPRPPAPMGREGDNDKGAVEGILSSEMGGSAVCGLDPQCDVCDGLDNSSVSSFLCLRSPRRGAESLLLGVLSAIFSLLIISLQTRLASSTIFPRISFPCLISLRLTWLACHFIV